MKTPVLLTKEFKSWKIHIRENLFDLLNSDELSLSGSEDNNFELTKYINNIFKFVDELKWDEPFRKHYNSVGFPLTIGVFPKEKELTIFSERLGFEQTFIKTLDISEQHGEYSLNEEDISHIEKLKTIVYRVACLDSNTFPTQTEFYTATNDIPDLMKLHLEYPEIDKETFELVDELALRLNSYKISLFERFTDYGLGLTASFAILRIHLLKFLAILTCLDHDSKGHEVKRILLEALRRLNHDHKYAKRKKYKGQNKALPFYIYMALYLVHQVARFIPSQILSGIIRFAVKKMARRFIAGENIVEAVDTIGELNLTNRDATLDQLGELVVSEEEAQIYFNQVLELISGLEKKFPNGEKNTSGIYKAHISIKISALCSDFKPHAFDYTYSLVSKRLISILQLAKQSQVFINIDAEHYSYRDLVFDIYKKVLLKNDEFKDYDQTGIVIQAYLRDSHHHFKDVLSLAKERKLPMPIRLVKGAYWDAETIESLAHNFIAPQFLNKDETDIRFRQLIYQTLGEGEFLILALASHNIHDHCWAQVLREKLFSTNSNEIEHQCLHMTYEALSIGLSQMNWPVRNYVPVGNLLVGMAYLVRRIMENSSQVGILTIMRSHKKLHQYTGPLNVHNTNKKENLIVNDEQLIKISSEYYPVSPFRSYIKSHLAAFKRSDYKLDFKLNREDSNTKIFSNINPSATLGEVKFFNFKEADTIINEMNIAYETGIAFLNDLNLRVHALLMAAEKLHYKRNSLAKLIMDEAGKSFLEALADVDEAVDFITYYLKSYLDKKHNDFSFTQRGLVGVIAPWNFPLAIPCGMAVAPLIAGNPVILKSSEKTPLIATILADIFYECGVPKSCFRHLAGLGPEVGSALTKSEKVTTIVFTGSKAVGKKIFQEENAKLLTTKNGKLHKNIIVEMGGKNAIIVTNNCELDETVSGILYAAFAHAGQKCSACSRVIIDNKVKDKFIKRFSKAVVDLRVASSEEFESVVNNIISKQDKEIILKKLELVIDEAKEHGTVHVDRSKEKGLHKLAIGPVVVELPYSRAIKHRSMANIEMFGPVIHIIGYNKIDEAIKLFNNTEYALTGGVYCQSQDDVDYLMTKLECGNIYINRPNTGARVGIEPFGGFKMSGTGPKAGSSDYLKSFIRTKKFKKSNYKEHNFIAGSAYMYINPTHSKLYFKNRKGKLKKSMQEFISKYESLTLEVNELEKGNLINLKDWLMSGAGKIYKTPYKNWYTPGQENYNKWNLRKDLLLITTYNQKPSFKCFVYFFSALLSGSGVLILARTNEAYNFWYGLLQILWGNGFSKNNIDVYISDLGNLKAAIQSSVVDIHFIDANIKTIESIISQSYIDATFNSKKMKKIITDFDGVDPENFESIYKEFYHVRSMAINTMRHGAPLDLNL